MLNPPRTSDILRSMVGFRTISAFVLCVLLVAVWFGCSSDAPTETPINHRPVLSTIGSHWLSYNDTFELIISASDPDGTTPSLTAPGLPPNSEFSDQGNGSGLFTYRPAQVDYGTHTALFIASDGILADSEEVILEVVYPINHPPELDSIPPYIVTEGDNLNFDIHATDVDGDSITLAAESVPPNATFVDHGDGYGTFDFTPDTTQAGYYSIWFTAHDGSVSDFKTGSIMVEDAPE